MNRMSIDDLFNRQYFHFNIDIEISFLKHNFHKNSTKQVFMVQNFPSSRLLMPLYNNRKMTTHDLNNNFKAKI